MLRCRRCSLLVGGVMGDHDYSQRLFVRGVRQGLESFLQTVSAVLKFDIMFSSDFDFQKFRAEAP